MAKKVSGPWNKEAFQDHLEETKGHVERLKRFSRCRLEEKPTGTYVQGNEGPY